MLELLAVAPKTYHIDELMPYPPYPYYSSGITDDTKALYKYGLRESQYPTLTLVDPIFDNDRDLIPPGHYELAISNDKTFLIIFESERVVATLPVFKYEEDKTQVKSQKPPHPLSRAARKAKKKAKKDFKQAQKYARQGMKPPESEPEVYMKASIEYDVEKRCYIIKYERGKIRAWGAIKG